MSTTNHPETGGQTERVNHQVECYLHSFIKYHPTRWVHWLSLYEYWYNTNWHTAYQKTSLEVIYGQAPHLFGISVCDTIDLVDVQEWLEQRQLIRESVHQHLFQTQYRMKRQVDKKRIEREFVVGDLVFLKLQPYAQSSVVHLTIIS